MWKNIDIAVEKTTKLKDKPEADKLGFGRHFTDHMFLMDWNRELGWHQARICPYQPFHMDPAATVLHYGQAIFEGLKAYRGDNGQIYLFRPEDNLERMNRGAVRMSMPRFSVDLVLKGLKALVYLDRDWIPAVNGASLYLRPTMIGVDPYLGLKPADTYTFYIIMSPVGSYYSGGFSPTKIYVCRDYVRAVKGGVGEVKTAGNYAASLLAYDMANKAGYTQVLWLDACERKYVEEVGTSNIFFVLDDTVVTPPLGGSILGGITRDSVINLAQNWGMTVQERPITIDEVLAASRDGRLKEAFATGTAAVISPVGELFCDETSYPINGGAAGPLAERLFAELQAIQYGRGEDPFNWRMRVG
ncbi:branched-chain amino acid aminotransferase [Desulfofustis limnaeus]|uniref:Branched-chain-amino-acid aminotransferase n=1 Tax=Desulfofustis limnaeus TaxID=2740163 RepID=A0ABN6M9L1_9BACT|nr:branched-chain amino acid aminotransferase [Desulfofustis limnaeus]BDD88650.1 branched-chain-amino-acid transaminase 1 [Desulfofustis limnaeus]